MWNVAIFGFSLLVLGNVAEKQGKVKGETEKTSKVCPVKMLLIGGEHPNIRTDDPASPSMEMYYPDMPMRNHVLNVTLLGPRYEHISELVNDHTVITCCGFHYDKEICSCETFDLHTNKVSWASNMTQSCRRRAASAVLDGIPYVCGGRHYVGRRTFVVDHFLATCERYESGVGSWTKITSMSKGRSRLAMVALDEYLYALGGYDYHTLDTVERYNPVSNSWTFMTPMKYGRHSLAAAVLKKLIYVCGGGYLVKSCEKYDPKTNVWSPFTSMNHWHGSFNLIGVGNRLFVVSQASTGYYDHTPEKYDLEQGKWQDMNDTVISRLYFSALLIPCV